MDEINIRIINLMVRLGHNKTSFAKVLQVSMPLITHITTGRNKPGLDIIQKILIVFKQINPDWLVNGEGDMTRHQYLKPDNTKIYEAIDNIETDLNKQKIVHETIKSYHNILIDEIKHLEEMKGIIELSTDRINEINSKLEMIRVQLKS